MEQLRYLPRELLVEVFCALPDAYRRWYLSTLCRRFFECYRTYWQCCRTKEDEDLFTPRAFPYTHSKMRIRSKRLPQYIWCAVRKTWERVDCYDAVELMGPNVMSHFRLFFGGNGPLDDIRVYEAVGYPHGTGGVPPHVGKYALLRRDF